MLILTCPKVSRISIWHVERILTSLDLCKNRQICHSFSTTRKRSRDVKSEEVYNVPIGTINPGGKNIEVDQYAEIYRKFTVKDISTFGHLVGDLNPIHFTSNDSFENKEEKWNRKTSKMVRDQNPLIRRQKVNKGYDSKDDDENDAKIIPLVHGQLISSLASSIFGSLIPGAIYRSQHLVYRKPVYANDLLKCHLLISKQRSFQKGVIVFCDMTVFNFGYVDMYNDENLNNFLAAGDSKEDHVAEKGMKFSNGDVCVDGEVKVWIPNICDK